MPATRAAFGAGLDPAGLFADEEGMVRTGAALLEEVRPLPAGYVGKLEMREPHARITGDVGVVTYAIAERLDLFGQRLDTRYHTTDVYQRTAGAWRLIASHTSVIPSELPRIALPPGARGRLCRALPSGRRPGGAGPPRRGSPGVRARGTPGAGAGADRRRSLRAGRPPARGAPLQADAAGRVDAFVDRRDNNDLVWRGCD